jgi:hypothetical protein
VCVYIPKFQDILYFIKCKIIDCNYLKVKEDIKTESDSENESNGEPPKRKWYQLKIINK